MLSNSIGKNLKGVVPRHFAKVLSARMMATAIDPRRISPDPPKPGKPKAKGWDRATFTIKVCIMLSRYTLDTESQTDNCRMDLCFTESPLERIAMSVVKQFFQQPSSDTPNP